MYVELHARSAFSFLEGACLPEELAAACAEQGIGAMAITDRDGVYGAPRFHAEAVKRKIKSHIGAEITLNDLRIGGFTNCRIENPIRKSENSAIRQSIRLPVIASSRLGYQNLCRLATQMKLRVPKNDPCFSCEEEIARYAEGLICLTGDEGGPLAQALDHGGIVEGRRAVERLTQVFGRENVYVELQRHYLRDEEARNQTAVEIARSLKLPLVATNGVRYARPQQREVLDLFTSIRNHRTLSTAGRLLAPNSERYVKSPKEMSRLFADLPEAIANTQEISSRLQFTLEDLGYEFPRYPVPEGETMMSFLRKRTAEGERDRYGRRDRHFQERAHRQIERELALIEHLKLEGYFLIVWDIVRYCREQGFLVQGRGSAANSSVCYSLGITAVDPVGMDLLFERFLSEERGEWPDIDLDLPSGDQRESVIQHVYARYGKLGAAMTANVITYRGRSAAREVGKALEFDEDTLERVSRLVGSWEYKAPDETLQRQFGEAGCDLQHPRMRKYLELCVAIQDMPRHLGQHSGGMVICQGQLDSVVPLEPASMPGRVVVQWDKEDCADMGIIKVDLLGLGMMAVLKDCLNLIRDHYDEDIDLGLLPADDRKTYAAMQKADTIGMFQIESRAQMSCLPRLRPERFYDVVIQVALIRPGPIVGQMVNPYIKRRQGRAPVEYPHPSLEPILERTLGVPLFQEQLLRMAMVAANFTGGEAEELRRALGKTRSYMDTRMREVERKMRAGMTQNGISQKAQDQIIQSIVSFALYGFPESHAASFALIAYASAYLKTHYLAAFTAAILNNQPMGFYHSSTLIKDAQRHGLRVLPVDIVKSEWECTIEKLPVAGSRFAGSSSFFVPRSPLFEEKCDLWFVDGGSKAQFNQERRTNNEEPAKNEEPTENWELRTENSNQERRTRNEELVLRLGFRYVRGMREDAAHALVSERSRLAFDSISDLARRVSELRKNELVTLADIGALNSLGKIMQDALPGLTTGPNTLVPIGKRGRKAPQFHRRDALWQAEAAAQPIGPLLEEAPQPDHASPLAAMTPTERMVADFRGTGVTVGPHPMTYHRTRLQKIGALTASQLPQLPNGRRVRVGGTVIVRQRPGTAHGFVFLSLEDETGVANIIITPDLFQRNRLLLVDERFLLVEGVLQNIDRVVSVKADRVMPLRGTKLDLQSHDFH
jgi:error-prone DNA polymerase